MSPSPVRAGHRAVAGPSPPARPRLEHRAAFRARLEDHLNTQRLGKDKVWLTRAARPLRDVFADDQLVLDRVNRRLRVRVVHDVTVARVAIPAPAGQVFTPAARLDVEAPLTWKGATVGRVVALVGITDDGLFAICDVDVDAPELFAQAFTPTAIPDDTRFGELRLTEPAAGKTDPTIGDPT